MKYILKRYFIDNRDISEELFYNVPEINNVEKTHIVSIEMQFEGSVYEHYAKAITPKELKNTIKYMKEGIIAEAKFNSRKSPE